MSDMEKYVTVYEVVEKQIVNVGDRVYWGKPQFVSLESGSLTYDVINSDVHNIVLHKRGHDLPNDILVTIKPENRWILDEVLAKELSDQVNSLKKKVEDQRQEIERHIRWGNTLSQEHASLHHEIVDLRTNIREKENATLWQRIKWVFTGVG